MSIWSQQSRSWGSMGRWNSPTGEYTHVQISPNICPMPLVLGSSAPWYPSSKGWLLPKVVHPTFPDNNPPRSIWQHCSSTFSSSSDASFLSCAGAALPDDEVRLLAFGAVRACDDEAAAPSEAAPLLEDTPARLALGSATLSSSPWNCRSVKVALL